MDEQDKIPFFKTWSQWYWLVLLVLVALIIFFAWFTNRFS